MTAEQLRATLDAAGYPNAALNGSTVVLRDRDDLLNYREHRDRLTQAGIPVLWGGGEMPRLYWFAVRLKADLFQQGGAS